jgi:hypothetical protein
MSWLILLTNFLLYSMMNKLQQLLNYNNLKYTKWILVNNWNSTQFRLDNGYNINEEILFEQKLDRRNSTVDGKFLLKKNTCLLIERIYNDQLFKLKLLYWHSKCTKKILIIIQFIWKRQLKLIEYWLKITYKL